MYAGIVELNVGVVRVEIALALVTAGLASFAIVPLMMRIAPRFGLVDQPADRKVHSYPIPRVGGWGIAAGVIAAILVWSPVDELALSYIWGIVVLFVFGAWDDREELGHYAKFIGQAVAVLPMVVVAGLYVTRFPFLDSALVPVGAAMAFTAVALIGMTNAVNHSDGLDGLAGGEAILSLVAIGLLAQADGGLALLIAVAVIGGVFGFLHYNTHPAVVFMGDSGSQVIGFSLGALAVMLVERVDVTLSPAVVVLLLGLPIADILYVFYRRIREGRNWFRATKNHVHHRLIERRFTHPEAVVMIYGIQIFFVASGLLLRHASDWLLAGVYLGGCAVVFGGLYVAERFDWYAPRRGEERGMWRWLGRGTRRKFVLVELPRRFLELVIPVYLVFVSISTTDVPRASALVSIGLLGLLAAQWALSADKGSLVRRAVIMCVGAMLVYLSLGDADQNTIWLLRAKWLFFALVAAAVVIAIRYSPVQRAAEFRTTGMDYLIVLVVILASLAVGPAMRGMAGLLVGLLVVVYAIELMITERRDRPQALGPASVVALVILSIRGFL